MKTLEEIRQLNKEAIIAKVRELHIINYDTVSAFLPKLLQEGQLNLNCAAYPSNAEGVGRYLVYDHEDENNPFSIWAFAFSPRQKTVIHDHKYQGTVTVLQEPISEKYYKPLPENLAQLVSRYDRYRFHTNSDTLDEKRAPFVHQLKRRKRLGEGISVTLHIYDMQAQYINEAGKLTDNRNLFHVYTKEKCKDKATLPAYEEEHSLSINLLIGTQ